MIYSVAFFFSIGTLAVIVPYLQVLLNNLGYGLEYVGIFLALFEGFGILGPLLLGGLASRKAWSKELAIFVMIASSVCFYALTIVDSLVLVIVLLILAGFFIRSMLPLLDSLVNNAVKGDSSKYTQVRATGTMGFVLVSGFLSLIKRPDVNSNKSIAFWFIFISFIAVVVMLFVPKDDKADAFVKPTGENKDDKWFNVGLIIGLIVIGLSRFSMSSVLSFLSIYSIEVVGYNNLSLLNLVAALSEFFTMLYCGYLLQNGKVKSTNLLIVSFIAIAIRLFIYAFLPTVFFMFMAQLIHSFAFGAFHVAAIMFINEHVRYDKRGLGISLYYAIGTSLPTVIGSSLGGTIVSNFGFKSLFVSYGLVSLLAALISIVFYKSINEKFSYTI